MLSLRGAPQGDSPFDPAVHPQVRGMRGETGAATAVNCRQRPRWPAWVGRLVDCFVHLPGRKMLKRMWPSERVSDARLRGGIVRIGRDRKKSSLSDIIAD